MTNDTTNDGPAVDLRVDVDVAGLTGSLEQVADLDPRLVASDLYDGDEDRATDLWKRGFRPILATDVRKGMTVVYYGTDVFRLGGVGEPLVGLVQAVGNDDCGTIFVEHSGGSTEADEYSEVWVGDQRRPADSEDQRWFDRANDRYDRYHRFGSPDATHCALCSDPIDVADENVAEMFDPTAGEEAPSAIVHYDCGEAEGWEVA